MGCGNAEKSKSVECSSSGGYEKGRRRGGFHDWGYHRFRICSGGGVESLGAWSQRSEGMPSRDSQLKAASWGPAEGTGLSEESSFRISSKKAAWPRRESVLNRLISSMSAMVRLKGTLGMGRRADLALVVRDLLATVRRFIRPELRGVPRVLGWRK